MVIDYFLWGEVVERVESIYYLNRSCSDVVLMRVKNLIVFLEEKFIDGNIDFFLDV